MKISLDKLSPNPMRDFGLYPMDPEHIERLRGSLHALGQFQTIAVRPDPEQPGFYQIGAGHHRVEAAIAEGLTEIDVTIGDYTTAQMVEIMVRENLTQRGYNAAAVLDSVAGVAKLIVHDVLLGDGEVSKNLETSRSALENARTKLLECGPGENTIYRVMNGFEKKDRAANKHAETITSTEIATALAALKNSGTMAEIVAKAFDEVEAERAERDRIEAEERAEAQRQREAAEERARVAEVHRKAAEAKEAEERRQAAEAKAARDAKAQKAAEERAARQAELAAEQAERKRVADAQAAEMRAEAAKRAEERKERAAREAEEAAKVKAQRDLEAVYDIRCANVFRLITHEKAFRDVVLSDNGRRFIPKSAQHALAIDVRALIDSIEKKRNHDLGSITIRQIMLDRLAEVMGMQQKIDAEEKKRLLAEHQRERIDDKWKTLARFTASFGSALAAIRAEYDKWPKDQPFPINTAALENMRVSATGALQLAEILLGYRAPPRKDARAKNPETVKALPPA